MNFYFYSSFRQSHNEFTYVYCAFAKRKAFWGGLGSWEPEGPGEKAVVVAHNRAVGVTSAPGLSIGSRYWGACRGGTGRPECPPSARADGVAAAHELGTGPPEKTMSLCPAARGGGAGCSRQRAEGLWRVDHGRNKPSYAHRR